MHSWRVLVLPCLNEARLYEQYRFDEPWDGPNNRRLAERVPDVFRCPDDERLAADGNVLTTYCAVSHAGAAFDGSRAVRLEEFRDGPAQTILVVESPGRPVHWMQPDDVSPDELWRSLAGRFLPRRSATCRTRAASTRCSGMELSGSCLRICRRRR